MNLRLLVAGLLLCACLPAHAQTASWYGEGQRTASGERFNPGAYACIIPFLPAVPRITPQLSPKVFSARAE